MSRFVDHPVALLESERIVSSMERYLRRDSPVFEFKPNVTFTRTVHAKSTGSQIYSTKISTDSLGRRVILRSNNIPKENVLLLGDSFTFGSGVDDDQTYGQFLQNRLPDARVLNFGLPAAGPQDVLEDFTDGKRFVDLSFETKTIAIFTGIDIHVERLLCETWRCFAQNRMRDRTPSKSEYVFVDNRLLRRGTFSENLSMYRWLMKLLSGSRFLDLGGWDRFLYSNGNFDFYGRFFSFVRDRLSERKIRFVYVFFPGRSAVHADKLRTALEKFDIEILDYSKANLASAPNKQDDVIFGDGHPSPSAYKAYANLLARDIFKLAP